MMWAWVAKLIRPIRETQELAGRLADGDIDAARKVDIKAEGEVGDLVKAIQFLNS